MPIHDSPPSLPPNDDGFSKRTQENIGEFMSAAMQAAQQVFMKHAEEQAAKGASAGAGKVRTKRAVG